MTLQVNGEVVSRNPDQELIRSSLSGFDIDRDGEGFLILAKNEMTYIQVSGDARRGFDAEYQEGDIDKHYRAENGPFSLDEVATMMTEYLQDDVDWKKYGTWSKIRW